MNDILLCKFVYSHGYQVYFLVSIIADVALEVVAKLRNEYYLYEWEEYIHNMEMYVYIYYAPK